MKRVIGLLLLTGCADDSMPPEEPPVDPPPGIVVRTAGRTIEPGEDRELCEAVRIPGDGEHFAGRIATTMTPGSHHLIIATVEPGSPTEAAIHDGDVVDCVGPTGFGDNVTALTGSQRLAHEESFPDGVARRYRGGQFLVFNYHYFNATDAPIEASAELALYDIDGARVRRLMGDAAFANLDIAIPPGAARTFATDCRFDRDLVVHKLTRHTHKWGTEVPVRFAGGPRDGELVFTSPSYEDADYTFVEPVVVRAGEGFRFDCNYTNTTATELVFGFKATDEMCILFAQITAPDELAAPLQLCVVDDPAVP